MILEKTIQGHDCPRVDNRLDHSGTGLSTVDSRKDDSGTQLSQGPGLIVDRTIHGPGGPRVDNRGPFMDLNVHSDPPDLDVNREHLSTCKTCSIENDGNANEPRTIDKHWFSTFNLCVIS